LSWRSPPHLRRAAAEEFQLAKLNVNTDHTPALACEDGNDKVICRKAIDTDFPLAEITLYFTNNVILWPSENGSGAGSLVLTNL
jgi:hypothetical protein